MKKAERGSGPDAAFLARLEGLRSEPYATKDSITDESKLCFLALHTIIASKTLSSRDPAGLDPRVLLPLP